ncbi:methyltransferase family protein [Nocardioides sp. SYSU DS0651]|uniref:methyltransferase family protein n=1 Tax=Nocardioides sp. SYSU DS0651 TaxID=3415955 RepID=UPI003F4C0A82
MPVVPPPVIALVAGVVQHAVAPDRGPDGGPGRGRKLAAGAVAAAAVGLDVSAMAAFRRHRTTVNPLDPAQASSIVAEGPFRFTRNPMYVGMAGLLTAHALARGGVWTFLPVLAFVAVIDRVQIAAEESALREKFGADYDDYCRSTRRWL